MIPRWREGRRAVSKRLIYAGLFTLVGLLGEIVFVDRMFHELSVVVRGRLMEVTIVVLVAAAYFIFQDRSPWVKRNGVLTYRRKDELVSDIYRARRALELRDPDTNDGWYLIELDTGKVLCLWDNLPSGPIGFDSMNLEGRRFPCTEFTILRHATENFTAEVDCTGQVIKPVTIQLGDDYDTWVYTCLPKDGEIIPDKTFDEVQADLLKAGGSGDGEIPPPVW